METLRARLALHGVQLLDSTADDGHPEWIATRWAMTRAFSDLASLEAFVDRVAGAAPQLQAAEVQHV